MVTSGRPRRSVRCADSAGSTLLPHCTASRSAAAEKFHRQAEARDRGLGGHMHGMIGVELLLDAGFSILVFLGILQHPRNHPISSLCLGGILHHLAEQTQALVRGAHAQAARGGLDRGEKACTPWSSTSSTRPA